MVWSIVENQEYEETKKHSGGKARDDINEILSDMQFKQLRVAAPQTERDTAGSLQKVKYHKTIARIWQKALSQVKSQDIIIFQFPVNNHTFYLKKILKELKQRGVKIIGLVHDLEMLRIGNNPDYSWFNRFRVNREELGELALFDRIIVHNRVMQSLLQKQYGVDERKMVSLEIFDYLMDENCAAAARHSEDHSCIIAGNLKREKSGFVYRLPEEPAFVLYGINYDGEPQRNIRYEGSFLSEELPAHLCGQYGLVWDGDSVKTCEGVWGRYLKINNPHKTSLYLACAFPVIVWSQAAIAGFVEKEEVGFTIDSIEELQSKIEKVDEAQYRKYCENAKRIAQRLQKGWYTKRAVETAMKGL